MFVDEEELMVSWVTDVEVGLVVDEEELLVSWVTDVEVGLLVDEEELLVLAVVVVLVSKAELILSTLSTALLAVFAFSVALA